MLDEPLDEPLDELLDELLEEASEVVSAFGDSPSAEAGFESSLPLLDVLEPLLLFELRLSVMYQPLPLKITPTGCSTRRMGPCPQRAHSVSGSAVTGCIFSNRCPQFLHAYSYTGILFYCAPSNMCL